MTTRFKVRQAAKKLSGISQGLKADVSSAPHIQEFKSLRPTERGQHVPSEHTTMRSARRKRLYSVLIAALLLIAACTNSAQETQFPTPTNPLSPIAPIAAAPPTASSLPTSPLPSATPQPVSPEGERVSPENEPTTPTYSYKVVNVYPHDRNAFTQGLIFQDGVLYEGTGLRGRSSLRQVALETGDVLQIHPLPDQFFGEGITIFGDRIIQLTWQSQTGFVYDKKSWELLQEFRFPTEGWGITHDGQRLIMSDGTATLYFWDPETLKEIGRVQVQDENGPVTRLNELEYIRGRVYANVWQTDRVAIIDPVTGQVTGWIDLTGLLDPTAQSQPVDVLNGIAYDAENARLFVTGKLWPKLFEIEIVKTDG